MFLCRRYIKILWRLWVFFLVTTNVVYFLA